MKIIELKKIEDWAIIESMQMEIEILEMKLKSEIMIQQRLLKMMGGDCGKEHYNRYKTAFMETNINSDKIKSRAQVLISPLRIVPIIALFFMC